MALAEQPQHLQFAARQFEQGLDNVEPASRLCLIENLNLHAASKRAQQSEVFGDRTNDYNPRPAVLVLELNGRRRRADRTTVEDSLNCTIESCLFGEVGCDKLTVTNPEGGTVAQHPVRTPAEPFDSSG